MESALEKHILSSLGSCRLGLKDAEREDRGGAC